MERTCEECGGVVDRPSVDAWGRPVQVVFCANCAMARQRRSRRDSYARWKAAHPGATSRARYNGSVGTEVKCATCDNRFVKRSGVHKFCDECRAANESYHDGVSNARNPNRPFGPKVLAMKAAA